MDVVDLVADLHDVDVGVRRSAAKSLKQQGPAARKAVPALITALDDEDLSVRNEAAMALGEMRKFATKAIAPLTDAFCEQKISESLFAKTVAGILGEAGWIKLLNHDSEHVRLVALREIDDGYEPRTHPISGQLIRPALTLDPSEREMFAKELIKRLKSNSATEVYQTIRCLTHFSAESAGAVPDLIQLVSVTETSRPFTSKVHLSDLQYASMTLLGKIGPESGKSVPVLINLFQNSYLSKEEIVSTLSQIGPKASSSIPMLVEYASSKKGGDLKQVIVDAIHHMGDESEVSLTFLANFLKSGHARTTRLNFPAVYNSPSHANGDGLAAWTLELAGEKAIPHLVKCLDAESERAGRLAAIALSEIGESCFPQLHSAVKQENTNVKINALVALTRLAATNKRSAAQDLNLVHIAVEDADYRVRLLGLQLADVLTVDQDRLKSVIAPLVNDKSSKQVREMAQEVISRLNGSIQGAEIWKTLIETNRSFGYAEEVTASLDGEYLAVRGTRDLSVWLVPSGHKRFEIPVEEVVDVCFSDDNRIMMTASYSGDLRFYRTQNGLLTGKIQTKSRTYAARLSPCGTMAAVLGKRLEIWDVHSHQLLAALAMSGRVLHYDQTGRKLVIGDNSSITVVDVQTGQIDATFETEPGKAVFGISDDRTTFLHKSRGDNLVWSFQILNPDMVSSVPVQAECVSLSLSSTTNALTLGAIDGFIYCHKPKEENIFQFTTGSKNRVEILCFIGQGTYLCAPLKDEYARGKVGLWRLKVQSHLPATKVVGSRDEVKRHYGPRRAELRELLDDPVWGNVAAFVYEYCKSSADEVEMCVQIRSLRRLAVEGDFSPDFVLKNLTSAKIEATRTKLAPMTAIRTVKQSLAYGAAITQ